MIAVERPAEGTPVEADVTTCLPPLSHRAAFLHEGTLAITQKRGKSDSHSLVSPPPSLYGLFGFAKDVVRRQNCWRDMDVSLLSPNTRLSQKIAGALS